MQEAVAALVKVKDGLTKQGQTSIICDLD